MKKILILFILIIIPLELKAEKLPILISQIMIGQNESAKNEFVELYNPNSFSINLESYSLKKKTANGTESNLVSAKNFVGKIPANGHFLISSKEYGQTIRADLEYSTSASLAKNNSIIIYDENKEALDILGLGEAKHFLGSPCDNPENNQTLKRISNTSNNLKDFKIEEKEAKIKNSKGEIIRITNQWATEGSKAKNLKSFKIKDLNTLEVGSSLIVEGVVLNLPGTLGAQFFYILEEGGDDACRNGVQIYNYYKNFPELKIGDKISVAGELSISSGGYRIKAEDIKVRSGNCEIPEMKELTIERAVKCPINSLVKIRGTISQNKTNAIYLDDGQDEILIEIKKTSGVNSKTLIENDEYTISGLMLETAKGKKISITSEDLIKPTREKVEESVGALSEDKLISLKEEKKSSKILHYFISLIVLTILIYFARKKIKTLLF